MNARELLQSGNLIQANPVIRTLRNGRRLVLLLLVLQLALQALLFALDIIYHHGVFVAKDAISPFGFAIVLSALITIRYTYQERYWKRIEPRRFVAARGDYSLLAAEQPWPEEVPTFLALFVELRRSRKFFLLMIALESPLALLMVSYFTNALVLYNNLSLVSSTAFLVFFVLFLLCALVPLAAVFTLRLRSSSQKITVTEGGMTVHDHQQVHMVRWQEARLFAMYNALGAEKNGAAITYELSSTRDIVRWTWVLRKTYWVGLEPTIAHDEYNRQMQALLSFVVTRTGLQLYDLRKGEQGGGVKD